MTETFYDVLGVAEDATTDEIRAAYRERLKETHPDVSDDADAGRATKRLIEARDVLVDDDERARYDRLGHDAYVGGDAESAGRQPSGRSGADGETASGTDRERTRDRARRERQASERVRQERERARRARQRRRQSKRPRDGGSDGDTAASASATGDAAESAGQRRRAADPSAAAAASNTYSVREDVAAPTSRGPLVPTGRELTLFGLFFALYPVLVFSAVLPAFPLFVNLVLGACTLLTISYLQSVPRVALWLFGSWSAIALAGLALLQVGFFSAVGLVVLSGTVLPFGFSVLTAVALRY